MRLCEKNGFTPDVIYTDDHVSNIVDLINQGMGCSLLMSQIVKNYPIVTSVPVKPLVEAEVALCYYPLPVLSDREATFLKFVQKQIRNYSFSE